MVNETFRHTNGSLFVMLRRATAIESACSRSMQKQLLQFRQERRASGPLEHHRRHVKERRSNHDLPDQNDLTTNGIDPGSASPETLLTKPIIPRMPLSAVTWTDESSNANSSAFLRGQLARLLRRISNAPMFFIAYCNFSVRGYGRFSATSRRT